MNAVYIVSKSLFCQCGYCSMDRITLLLFKTMIKVHRNGYLSFDFFSTFSSMKRHFAICLPKTRSLFDVSDSPLKLSLVMLLTLADRWGKVPL